MLHHDVEGKGLHIDSESAWCETPVNICNYRIDFQNRDKDQIYSTQSTGTQWNCRFGEIENAINHGFDVHRGVECARLFVNEEFRGNSVTPYINGPRYLSVSYMLNCIFRSVIQLSTCSGRLS